MAKLQTKQTFFLFFLLLAWIIQEPNAVIWQQVQPHQSLSEKELGMLIPLRIQYGSLCLLIPLNPLMRIRRILL